MVVAYLFSDRFTRRIRHLQSFAEHLVETRAPPTCPPMPTTSSAPLARSLNRMATQLRDSLDRLSLESARREAILSSMVEGVLAVDQHMRITFCNESFARVAGIPVPVPQRTPLLEVVRDAGLLDMLSRSFGFGNAHSSGVFCCPPPMAILSKCRPRRSRSLPVGAPSPCCTTLRTSSVSNECARISSPMSRTSCAPRLPRSVATRKRCSKARSRTRKTTATFVEIIKAQAARLNNIASDLLVLSELESGRAEPAEPEAILRARRARERLRTVESKARVRGVTLKSDRSRTPLSRDRGSGLSRLSST